MDTSAFYNENELKIHKKLNKCYLLKKNFKKKSNKKNITQDVKNRYNTYITRCNIIAKKIKSKLCAEFPNNSVTRTLQNECLNKKNIISVFESTLTRILKIPENTLSLDLIVVRAYFFDILEDIILDGFYLNNEKYICLTASAGQIRTKKTVFIRENALKEIYNTLTCGLSIEDINAHGGVNINKYLAYLALSNSATDLWSNFDITKTIVVEDMETLVPGIVDLIDDVTYKVERKEMNIPITHTDGCGMILPKINKKNFMFRSPWVKGLLAVFPFDIWINENSKEKYCGVVKDIYGEEHDILKEGIEIIFTKSQFKMWKYYNSWKHYIDNFKKYNCQAGICNEEEDVFGDAKINYQMMQTLVDMTDEELEKICRRTKYNIYNMGRDRKTMLRVLGVTESNDNKNYIQQALEVYPELLNDTYSKEILKAVKKRMVKDGRAAKLDIDGVYTFICPDLYAFCEYLFLGNQNPDGLLKDGEVCCKLYENEKKLDCLRSPHLYREHPIRVNKINDNDKKWFITDGLYTSCHDIISKVLQFDVDGDKSLVCADNTVVSVAERNMKDIVPLYYNMRKADPMIINNQTIYNGLKTAYTGGNIGMISNDITKIWNSENVNIDIIKLLCMENNFTIDYAKTLYKPERPKEVKKRITNYTKNKVPHFFIYAKDKTKEDVEPINNSIVNKLERIIENPRLNFKAMGLGKFNYRMLMKNPRVILDDALIKKYNELDLKKKFMISKSDIDETSNIIYLYNDIKNQLLSINCNASYVTDVLIKYLYCEKKANFKTTLWECFGDIIVENLKNNIKLNNTYCIKCGDLIQQTSNRKKYCDECWKESERQRQLIKWHKNKHKYRNATALEHP